MSGVHKYPTISFRVSPRERDEIEAKITASGMQMNLMEAVSQFEQQEVTLSSEGVEELRNDCLSMLKAILWMLDGAKYLWQGAEEKKEKSPDSGNC